MFVVCPQRMLLHQKLSLPRQRIFTVELTPFPLDGRSTATQDEERLSRGARTRGKEQPFESIWKVARVDFAMPAAGASLPYPVFCVPSEGPLNGAAGFL